MYETVARRATLGLVGMASCLMVAPVPAQDDASSNAGPVPRMADGHPDLSGVWWGGADVGGRGARLSTGPRDPNAVTYMSLYQPWAAEKAKTLSDEDDPTLRCVPTAFGTLTCGSGTSVRSARS